jgi:hypothetical protein
VLRTFISDWRQAATGGTSVDWVPVLLDHVSGWAKAHGHGSRGAEGSHAGARPLPRPCSWSCWPPSRPSSSTRRCSRGTTTWPNLTTRSVAAFRTRLGAGRPYDEFVSIVLSEERFDRFGRRGRTGRQTRQDIRASERPAMAWQRGPGPTYSPGTAEKLLRNRYDVFTQNMRYTLPRLLADQGFRELITQLRAEGWKDWDIALAVFCGHTLFASTFSATRLMTSAPQRPRRSCTCSRTSPSSPSGRRRRRVVHARGARSGAPDSDAEVAGVLEPRPATGNA